LSGEIELTICLSISLLFPICLGWSKTFPIPKNL
jgi:hypothetical protein